MPPSPSSQPQFTRRRRTKGRPRTRASIPPHTQAIATDSDDDHHNPSMPIRLSKPQPRPRATTVAHTSTLTNSSPEALRPDYSTEGLRRLREAHTLAKPSPSTNHVHIQKIPDTPKKKSTTKPGPFSAAWRGERNHLNPSNMDVDEDPTIAIISDLPDESLPGADMHNVVQDDDGSASDESGVDWVAAQMLRGGANIIQGNMGLYDTEMDREDVRMGEEEIEKKTDLTGVLRRIKGEWKEDEKKMMYAKEEMDRLVHSETTAKARLKEVRVDVEMCEQKIRFYEELADVVREVYEIVAKFKEKMIEKRKEVLKRMEGVDEFGRQVRENTTEMMMEEEGEEILKGVRPEICSGKEIIHKFDEWHRLYPEEYLRANGDEACGKLLGTLGLRHNSLGWLMELPEKLVPAAARTAGTLVIAQMLVQENWIYSVREGKLELLEEAVKRGIAGENGTLVAEKCKERVLELMKDVPVDRVLKAVLRMQLITNADAGLALVLHTAQAGDIEDPVQLRRTVQRISDCQVYGISQGLRQIAQQWLHDLR